MAFVANNNQQMTLSDSTFHLTEREKNFLEKSWAKVFAEKIFPKINEKDFSVLYSNEASRPNTPVNVIVGGMILKEALGLTDDEVLQSLLFDIRFQYALHTTSFSEQPLSDRSFSRFRARCLSYETETGIDLVHACITGLAKEISEFMGIAPDMRRMDSVMVAANIRNLSLLELFYTCTSNLAKIMKQRGLDIPAEQEHYTQKDDYNSFIYHKRDLDAAHRTEKVMHDAEKLLETGRGIIDDTSEYQLLIRLLKEQTIHDDDGNRRLRKKDEKEESSKALMNPSDPEATFRRKAGKKHIGYVGNIIESVGETGSVVTDYAYEQNVYSDSHFMKDYLSGQPANDEIITLVADGAYGGEKNVSQATGLNIKLITTNFTGRKPDDIYADFKFNADGTLLLKCINGKEPEECTYDSGNDRSVAYFSHETCNGCPYKEKCRPRFLKNRVRKEVSWKAVNRSLKLRYMNTDEFKEYAHFRNGVEAIPSLLRRKYKIDKIPAHGKKQTRLHFGFKVAAINFQKLMGYTAGFEKTVKESKAA